MMSRHKLPARLHGAPAALLDHAWRASEGDWSRVVWEDGAIVIHNHTTFTRAELPQETAQQKVWHMGAKPKRVRVIGADRSEANMDSVYHRARVREAS
jgi:hypothetical protein